MHSTLQTFLFNATNSKSTEKLVELMEGLKIIPDSKMDKIKSINVTWSSLQGYQNEMVVVPCLDIQFFE